MSRTFIFEHPLINHKISILRDEKTGTRDFRTTVEEIASLMCYEVFRDLASEIAEIKTPVAVAHKPVLSGRSPAIVPILRAGLGMVNGILYAIPSAKVGHIGLSRNEVTHEPYEYYVNIPKHINERLVVIPDPMLATGGSAIHAIDYIKKLGCNRIKFMCIIAAPEGLKRLEESHPDIDIYVGTVDEKLNENAYIVPGLGDAGDRIFGTNE